MHCNNNNIALAREQSVCVSITKTQCTIWTNNVVTLWKVQKILCLIAVHSDGIHHFIHTRASDSKYFRQQYLAHMWDKIQIASTHLITTTTMTTTRSFNFAYGLLWDAFHFMKKSYYIYSIEIHLWFASLKRYRGNTARAVVYGLFTLSHFTSFILKEKKASNQCTDSKTWRNKKHSLFSILLPWYIKYEPLSKRTDF